MVTEEKKTMQSARQNRSSRDVLVKDTKQGQDALTRKQGNLTPEQCFK